MRIFFVLIAFFALQLHATPLIKQLNPNYGPRTGGTSVEIVGHGFIGTTSVTFDGEPANFNVVNNDLILASSPTHVPGVAQVQVTTSNGSSPLECQSNFDYQGNWIDYITTLSTTLQQLDIPSFSLTPTTVPFTTDLIAITPNGKFAYLPDSSANVINVLDLATNAFVTAIPGGINPLSIAITPNGSRAYVSNRNFINTPGANNVSVIELATNTVIATIPLSFAPTGIAVHPDGTTLYVSNRGNQVNVVDLSTNNVTATIPVGTSPLGIQFRPDGTRAYVVNQLTNNVSVIDTSTENVIATIGVGNAPGLIAITPNGERAYVTNVNFPNTSSISVLNLDTNTNIQTINLVGESVSIGIAVSPDGQWIFVCNAGTSSTTIIDTTTNTIFDTVNTPCNFNVVTPDQAPVAVFSTDGSQVNGTIIFDASASTSPTGDIVLYEWDFGDGQTASSTEPTISHQYAQLGSYTVTLTVTNSTGTSTSQVFTGQTMLRNGGTSAICSQTLPQPPSNFKGKVIKNKFATQTEYVHRLTWTPSLNIIEYQLYRNGKKIAVIPGRGPFSYDDHNRRKHEVDTYSLIAISEFGLTSLPVETIVK